MKSTQVFRLKAGDVLTSGAKVVKAPVAGLKTPKGKMEIVIEYPNGDKRAQVWGKHTAVGLV